MLSLTVDTLRGGFWGFSALVSGVTSCTFYAPEIMVAVFLRVCNFALYYLFLYKRWFDLNYRVHQPVDVVDIFVIFFFFFCFMSVKNSDSGFFCDSVPYVADVSYFVTVL